MACRQQRSKHHRKAWRRSIAWHQAAAIISSVMARISAWRKHRRHLGMRWQQHGAAKRQRSAKLARRRGGGGRRVGINESIMMAGNA